MLFFFFFFAGDHCEDVQCTCPSLQMCTQRTAGYICLPACSTNTTCSTSAVSIVSWEQVVAVCMSATGIGLFVLCYIGYRWVLNTPIASKVEHSLERSYCFLYSSTRDLRFHWRYGHDWLVSSVVRLVTRLMFLLVL